MSRSANHFFTGASGSTPNYIEDVFNTYLWRTSTSNQTIANGIDMTKGAMTWIKSRSNVFDHVLQRAAGYGGAGKPQYSNSTSGGFDGYYRLTDTTSGFTMGTDYYTGTPQDAVVWTFRKQPKFFDIVTYTGNGVDGRTITSNHNMGTGYLGAVFVKRTDTTSNWKVSLRGGQGGQIPWLSLNLTAADSYDAWTGGNINPGVNGFSVSAYEGDISAVNANGGTYVAYLFAHNAGGFGLTGNENVITCGTYVGNGSNTNGTTVDLGWEPQWIIIKRQIGGTSDWLMVDNMRGMTADGTDEQIKANGSGAADSTTAVILNSTGFQLKATGNPNTSGSTYVYIAIRRGPMKVPTVGTSVFNSVARTGDRLAGSLTGIGFNPDSLITLVKPGGYQHEWNNKLAGSKQLLRPTTNESEFTSTDLKSYDQDGISFNATDFNSNINRISPLIQYFLKRAPSVFDIVCYSGNSTARTINHNLGVAPELMIVKSRNYSGPDWQTYASPIGNTSRLLLNDTGALADGQPTWNYTTPTSSVFSLGTSSNINGTSYTYVAYLFATCAGVSKVGSYTGTGALQTINCGFTSGARFVLIKRTDSTGSWWLYDSTRGISSSDDPYLFLNSNGAEVTNTNYVDTDTTGFKVTAAAPAGINANGGTYIFLAIA